MSSPEKEKHLAALTSLEAFDKSKEVIEIRLTNEQAEAMKELIDFIKESDVEVIIRDDKNI
ncbi:hypothetical protein [Campylobacter concisus]|uniref:hypothetical protein n=1 Tax=Campylobacter concisus TaxID=199 RepID=UPI000D3C0C50|nr:hypothetical protein [Campylobacter concisus]QPH88709.1 hypothetical protein CVT15_08355 [Campylobacter concisus]